MCLIDKFCRSHGVWFDIFNISCANHRIVAFDYQNAIIDKFPHDFRCIHKNITKFFNSSDCDEQEDCEQVLHAINHYSSLISAEKR